MMEFLLNVINNALMQSLILGPLMGVVFGALFSGLNSPLTSQAPSTIIQTREVYITRIVERESTSKSSDDGMGFIFAGVALLLFVIWKYAVLFDVIQQYLAVSILTVLCFSATTITISFIKGHYTSPEWWLYTLGPLSSLFACMYLLVLAKNSFDPNIQQGAMNNNVWTFYSDWLSEYGRHFMFAHVIGVAMLASSVLLVALSLVYYLSLMNQRSGGVMQGFWIFATKRTSLFAGKSWMLIIAVFLTSSYICIDPDLLTKWTSKG